MFSGDKTIKLVLALLFTIVSLVGFSSCAAATTGVSLVLSSQAISSGDTFTVDVFVEPDTSIAGMQFNLEFDDTKMYVESVTEGNLFRQSNMKTYFIAGTIGSSSLNNVYGTILGASDVRTPSVFATVTMVADVRGMGASTINLKNVIISDPEGHAVDITVTNATLKITDKYDVNGDGIVNIEDCEIVELHFSENTFPPYPDWDVNSDAVVNIIDIMLVSYNID